MRTKILAIFTCFNRREKTLQALERLVAGNPQLDISFIAVDDHSTDGTLEALEQLDYVKLLSGKGDLYYTGGMRKGMAYAQKQNDNNDYVLLFNDDVEFYENTVQRMVEAIKDSSDIVLVGATCGSDGQITYGGVKKISKLRPSFQILKSNNKKVYCDTFNANCVLIPWKIFQKAPVMDKHYRHSLGDFAYGLTLRKMGYLIEASDFFVGRCEDNPAEGTWRDPRLSRKERIRKKESPKGLPTKEWFYFVKTYFNVVSACAYAILPYIKIILRRPT